MTAQNLAGRRLWRSAASKFVVTCGVIAFGLGIYQWWDDRPVGQIEAALQERKFALALKTANSFLREHPNHGRVQELKARALVGLQRWNEAVQLLEQVGVATTEGERAWSVALLHQNRWSEAQPLLTHLHQESPSDTEILHELIACNGKLGFIDDATTQAERLSQIAGHEARGSLMLGTLHNNRLNRKQAIQAWQRVLQFDPNADHLQITAAEFFLAYGRVLLLEGQPKEAIPMLEKSVALQATATVQAYLGDAYEQAGDLDRAIASWKQAVGAEPKSVRAREGLARSELLKKHPSEALEWIAPLLDKPGYQSSTAYLAQRASAMLGRSDEVAKWEKRVAELRRQEQRRDLIETGIQRAPQSFWSQAVLAHRFASSGNKAQATAIVAALLKTKPEEEFVQALARHLGKGDELPSLDLIPMQQF